MIFKGNLLHLVVEEETVLRAQKRTRPSLLLTFLHRIKSGLKGSLTSPNFKQLWHCADEGVNIGC